MRAGNTVKRSISVPTDLNTRMEATGGVINWSAIACQAFESKLAELIKQKGVRDMSDVINRLRVSKRVLDDSREAEGREQGRGWAEAHAEAVELDRIESLERAAGGDLARVLDADDQSAYSAGEVLAFAILDDQGHRRAAKDFWDQYTNDDAWHDEGFVRGFAEGALELWKEVKGQL